MDFNGEDKKISLSMKALEALEAPLEVPAEEVEVSAEGIPETSAGDAEE